uniref:CD70 antigen n=1 Tax=Monodon monoceros TaxID=40151 RepID=A0A8C6FAV8_MONMO
MYNITYIIYNNIYKHLYPFYIYVCMVCVYIYTHNPYICICIHICISHLLSPFIHQWIWGSRQDPRLRWQGSPALGRSFVHGPELDNGQLRIQRDGIYRLHIQVTLANCSSSTWTAKPLSATLSVAICFPTAHSISLLRLNFHQSCSVASQRLTFLAHGDILCTNLTPPLLPSRNADETFFGIQWVCP